MKTVSTISDLREIRKELNNPLGFVPTMGYLHEGHLSLVRKAKSECESVAVSIYVNPSQFSPDEDLASYPRDIERDIELLKKEGVDLVWIPNDSDMYPEGFQTWVEVQEITNVLEGGSRPTHFRGVTTIVTKLFNAVQPQKAYFGQKDAQQAVVIKRMVNDLNIPVEVVICPISRESDGVARSSRNKYLSSHEREAATALSRSLKNARLQFKNGERDAEKIRSAMLAILNEEPLAKVLYVSCADTENLKELSKIESKALLSMAVVIGKTRLIDNMILE